MQFFLVYTSICRLPVRLSINVYAQTLKTKQEAVMVLHIDGAAVKKRCISSKETSLCKTAACLSGVCCCMLSTKRLLMWKDSSILSRKLAIIKTVTLCRNLMRSTQEMWSTDKTLSVCPDVYFPLKQNLYHFIYLTRRFLNVCPDLYFM